MKFILALLFATVALAAAIPVENAEVARCKNPISDSGESRVNYCIAVDKDNVAGATLSPLMEIGADD